MTGAAERLAEKASWHAARLVGAVRDEGPDVVAALLANCPDDRLDAVCVALAAMVDPDRTPGELLAWTDWDARGTEHRRLLVAGVNPAAAGVPTAFRAAS